MLRTRRRRCRGARSRSPAVMCGAARTSSGVMNMLRIPAASSGPTASSVITPDARPSFTSTKPNSPNCPRPTPASHATRAGKRMVSAASVARAPLATRNPSSRASTRSGIASTTRASKSIPRETKKMLTKASRSGRMSPMARCPYSVSATTIPPRKAPSARESPACAVSHAVPMHIARIARRNTSRLRLASTRASSRGTA